MPRASWSGFLRLSLVSCPVYLSPATTRTKSLRLHQVWRPAAGDQPGPEEPDRERDEQLASGSRPQPADPRETERADQATRIALRPHDPRTGEELEKSEVVKGYEYGRGQFITSTVFSTSSASTIAIPTLLPMLRVRLKIAVPCVRICRGKVEKVTMLKGVKTRPRPNPCSRPVKITGPIQITSEKPVICHRTMAVRAWLVRSTPSRSMTSPRSQCYPSPI